MDVCVEMSGAAVDWLLLLMAGMLIREIFIDPGDSEMSQTCSTHAQQHVHTHMMQMETHSEVGCWQCTV